MAIFSRSELVELFLRVLRKKICMISNFNHSLKECEEFHRTSRFMEFIFFVISQKKSNYL